MAGEGDSGPLEEGRDFYWNPQGLMVLTQAYLERRGYCCHNGCRHCPYQGVHENAPPRKSR